MVILGGGAAGMLAALEMTERIHPDNITVIAEKFRFLDDPGLHYLHNDEGNKELLTKLGLQYEVAPVNGAIINKDGELCRFIGGLRPQEMVYAVQAHYLKTRGKDWQGSVRSMNSLIERNFDDQPLEKLTVKISDLTVAIYTELQSRGVHLIVGKAELVLPTVSRVQYTHNSVVEELGYDYIISTIPLRNLLVEYVALDQELPQIDRWYNALSFRPVYTRAEPVDRVPEAFREWDFIYSPFQYGWYRASKSSDGAAMYFEFSSEVQARAFKRHDAPSYEYGHIFSECPGVVDDILTQFKRKRIYCIGRFGRWNAGTLVHQVIQEARETADWIAESIKDEIVSHFPSDQTD